MIMENHGRSPDGKMTIPQIRERLFELAEELDCEELAALAEATRRRAVLKRAPPRSQRMTNALADEICDYAEAHPHLSNERIGRVFNVAGGRVTQAMQGFEWDE